LGVHGAAPPVAAGGGCAAGARALVHSARKLMCARTGSEPTSSALFAERPTTLAYDARAVQATMQRWHARGLALTVAFCSTVTCNTSLAPALL